VTNNNLLLIAYFVGTTSLHSWTSLTLTWNK